MNAPCGGVAVIFFSKEIAVCRFHVHADQDGLIEFRKSNGA
jgi:hypothetical protein